MKNQDLFEAGWDTCWKAEVAPLLTALRDLVTPHEAGKQPPVRAWAAARVVIDKAEKDK